MRAARPRERSLEIGAEIGAEPSRAEPSRAEPKGCRARGSARPSSSRVNSLCSARQDNSKRAGAKAKMGRRIDDSHRASARRHLDDVGQPRFASGHRERPRLETAREWGALLGGPSRVGARSGGAMIEERCKVRKCLRRIGAILATGPRDRRSQTIDGSGASRLKMAGDDDDDDDDSSWRVIYLDSRRLCSRVCLRVALCPSACLSFSPVRRACLSVCLCVCRPPLTLVHLEAASTSHTHTHTSSRPSIQDSFI